MKYKSEFLKEINSRGFIYQSAEIDKAHGGIIYMTPLHNSTPFELPKVDD